MTLQQEYLLLDKQIKSVEAGKVQFIVIPKVTGIKRHTPIRTVTLFSEADSTIIMSSPNLQVSTIK